MASRSCFKYFCSCQAASLLHIKKGLTAAKVLETDTRSKKYEPLWKVKGFEQYTSCDVRVPDCVFPQKISKERVTPTCKSAPTFTFTFTFYMFPFFTFLHFLHFYIVFLIVFFF